MFILIFTFWFKLISVNFIVLFYWLHALLRTKLINHAILKVPIYGTHGELRTLSPIPIFIIKTYHYDVHFLHYFYLKSIDNSVHVLQESNISRYNISIIMFNTHPFCFCRKRRSSWVARKTFHRYGTRIYWSEKTTWRRSATCTNLPVSSTQHFLPISNTQLFRFELVAVPGGTVRVCVEM